jgi:cell division septation protein DedD
MSNRGPEHEQPRVLYRRPRRRGRRPVLLLLALAGLAGFLVGYFVIGERYVKKQASPVRHESVSLPPSAGIPTTPLPSGSVLPPPEPVTGSEVVDPRRPATPNPPAPTATPPAAGPVGPHYTVQVGVFVEADNAESLRDDLANRGYHASVKTADSEGTKTHRVRVGSYLTREEAERASREMASQGYQVIITPEN